MNRFNVKCPVCNATYIDVVWKGVSKLLHFGLEGVDDQSSPTPSPKCTRVIDYVTFYECRHCCPSSFESCPVCILEHPEKNLAIGKSSEDDCFCI